MFVSCCIFVDACWLLGVAFYVACGWLLVVWRSLNLAWCSLFFGDFALVDVCCLVFVMCGLLFVVHCLLIVDRCWLCVVCCLFADGWLCVVCCLLFVVY